jgi:hypothetical protein
MKKIVLTLVLLVSAISFASAQSRFAVKTEAASGLYEFYSQATVDTLISASELSGAGAFIVGLSIGTPVDGSVIVLRNGVDTVWAATIDNGANDIRPYFVAIGARVDTSLIYSQTLNSKVTLIYRTSP